MFFDSTQEEDVSFEPLPKGNYKLTVTNTEYGPSNSGNGTVLKLEFQVEGQERKLFDTFNVEHSNPKAQQIGRGQLKRFCVLAGRPQLRRPEDLLGAQICAEVTHREYNGNIYANVKKYLARAEPNDKSVNPGVELPRGEAHPLTPANEGIPF